MYLKKLSTQGFKSFASRTAFEFGPGITAVVGPNGSGKSNVADAIRWVLGEQNARMLRARKQEDVIFSGGGQRAPVGMAEVLLTLDNTDRWLPIDFTEIEIGRRLYRSGETEYLLNGSRVRLRDITELLAQGDVGQNSYTIMGQGLVDEVLLMSPEERRGFLDEAADVKRFRTRIREAHDRLAATRSNLERVHLILGELEPRLTQLRRQAERAAAHSRLMRELIDLLRVSYGHQWAQAQNSLVRTRAMLDQRTAENQAASGRVAQLRDQLRALSEEIRKRRDTLTRTESHNADLEARIAATEHELALDRERHAMITARQGEIQVEVGVLEAERVALAASGVDDEQRRLQATEQAEAARARIAECRTSLEQAERDFATAGARARELRDGIESDERRANGIEGDVRGALRRIDDLAREDEAARARRRQLLVELIGYGRRYAEARAAMLQAEGEMDAARLSAGEARQRLATVEDEVRSFERLRQQDLRELDHLEGRLEALRRVQAEHDGVAAGTRAVLVMGQALIEGIDPGTLGEPAELSGVLGLLSRQLRVPPGLEAAINAALELRLHAVIVEHEEQALQAITALQSRRGGRVQFLPLDSVRHIYALNLSKERGVVGVASKLVRCENRVRPLIDTLLGRVIIVEDVPTAQRMIRRGLGSVVTIDGTLFEPGGTISGGASGAEQGPFIRQRELDELPVRIEELRKRTDASARQLSQAREAVEQGRHAARRAEAAYEALMSRVRDTRSAIAGERDRLHRLRRELDSVRAKRADITRERDARERSIAQAREASEAIGSRDGERRTALAAAQQDLEVATGRREAALRDLAEASSRLAAVDGERRALVAMREQHERSLARLAEQVTSRRLQARNLDLEADVIAERLNRLAREHETLARDRASHADDGAPDRDELHRLESHERQVQDDLNDAQAELLRLERGRLDLEAEIARLSEHVQSLEMEMAREGLAADRTGMIVAIEDLASRSQQAGPAAIQGGADIDVEAVRAQIEDVRRQIRRLGPINEEAPEDFRESESRFAFLTAQVQDLTEAEIQLRDAIRDLNEEIRARFNSTFERVNLAFGEYFAAFFGGGTAHLILTDPESPAETGLEIEAQPPGKRLRSLSLLSGGERSLTAVALLFSLLTVNPAPFCVLDEVDAALDEANVGRFTGALTDLASRTQFLIVTHNRRTIEVADAIYGVSMAKDGISKVLSVRIDDLAGN